eukprot:gene40040-52875_t
MRRACSLVAETIAERAGLADAAADIGWPGGIMDWYLAFKFLHVAAAVIWIGGAFIMIMFGVKAERSSNDAELVGAVRQIAWAAERIYVPSSMATLVFGLILLLIGVVFRHRGARALSFIFVLAATIKVFLFDAAALTGLWRVLSFLLMGLSFLGISWAYARFVFGIGVRRSMPPPRDPPAEPTVTSPPEPGPQ